MPTSSRSIESDRRRLKARLLRQRRRAAARPHEDVDAGYPRIRLLQRVAEQLGTAQHHRHEVVALVGDASGEPRHRLHPLHGADPRLQALALGRVDHRDEHGEGLVPDDHRAPGLGPQRPARAGEVLDRQVLGHPLASQERGYVRVHARAFRGREQAREGLANQVLGGEGAVHAGERAVGEEDHAVLMDAHAERRPLDEALVAGLALLHHLLGPSQRLLRAHALRHVDGVTVHAGRPAGDGEADVPVLPDLLVAVLGQHHHQPAVGALALDAVEVRVEQVLDQGRQVIAEAPAHHVLGARPSACAAGWLTYTRMPAESCTHMRPRLFSTRSRQCWSATRAVASAIAPEAPGEDPPAAAAPAAASPPLARRRRVGFATVVLSDDSVTRARSPGRQGREVDDGNGKRHTRARWGGADGHDASRGGASGSTRFLPVCPAPPRMSIGLRSYPTWRSSANSRMDRSARSVASPGSAIRRRTRW